MRILGVCIALFGWLTSVQGYTLENVFVMALGIGMIFMSYNLERR